MGFIGAGITLIGVVVQALMPLFSNLKELYPNVGWISAIAGALMAIGPIIAYISGRSAIKTAQVNGTTAQALAAVKTANP